MKLTRLYLENFLCYDETDLSFDDFSAALIVAKIDNNDLYSNGAGKTSIFKAIEYVLFNQSDSNLEKVIRDEQPSCRVVLDFEIENQSYRISRKRTRKGSSDLSLFERTELKASKKEIDDLNIDNKCWKDISGRRAQDTEKDLAKLIKINFKSFRSTVHFMQNDFSGLTTATPEKRKGILKEALNLAIYQKLEKIAKEKASLISKEINKCEILIDNIKDPANDILDLNSKISQSLDIIAKNQSSLDILSKLKDDKMKEINDLTSNFNSFQSKNEQLILKESNLLSEKLKIETSIKEYTTKKSNAIKTAKDLLEEIKSLKIQQDELSKLKFDQISILTDAITANKESIAQHNLIISNNVLAYEELKVPMPDQSVCKHCRQSLSKERKEICQKQINQDMDKCLETIKISKAKIAELSNDNSKKSQTIRELSSSKIQLDQIDNKISLKKKEVEDKKALHTEYSNLLIKFSNSFEDKIKDLDLIKIEIEKSSIEEGKQVSKIIQDKKKERDSIMQEFNLSSKELTHQTSSKAVMEHSLNQRKIDLKKKEELSLTLLEHHKKYKVYPSVIQAFSSTGIPNLIIQNVLDDLQIQANKILSQLKPNLQLQFHVEKTKDDGTQDDTLDIKYMVNGKEREYDLISGAMKLAVTFALKLGLSSLLQEMIGTDVKFLMLDEIDQSLDKASVDSFVDIVKFFQKEYKVLIITHNDRLKDKFSHAILVEQDMNMISRAKVVTKW